MAADAAEVWQHMTPEESDKVPKMVAVAFANAITNQTMLQGLSNLVGAVSDPDRKGAKFAQGMAAMHVPSALAQVAQLEDNYVREVNSILDAIKDRIPGFRETLLAQRDVFGEPIANRERVGGVSPIREISESQDRVRRRLKKIACIVRSSANLLAITNPTGEHTMQKQISCTDVAGIDVRLHAVSGIVLTLKCYEMVDNGRTMQRKPCDITINFEWMWFKELVRVIGRALHLKQADLDECALHRGPDRGNDRSGHALSH
jgi:hypothetical protein